MLELPMRSPLLVLILSFPLLPIAWAGEDDDDEEAMEAPTTAPAMPAPRMRMELDFAPIEIQGQVLAPNGAATYGVQAGGARDTRAFRELLAQGQTPPPALFTAEGLFSEHDLPPRRTGPCAARLCLSGEAAQTELHGHPEAQVLAQLGFDTDLPPDQGRPPMEWVLVASGGSSDPQAAALAEALARLLRARLTAGDRVSALHDPTLPPVVGAEAEDLAPWQALRQSTLRPERSYGPPAAVVGALEHARTLTGGSGRGVRVIWLSFGGPEQRASGLPALREAAARAADQGVGLTAIGLGADASPTDLGWVGALPGGVQTRVGSTAELVGTFAEDLESLLWPLAYGLGLEIQPAPGWRLAGVYGVPGAALTWDATGTARLSVKTLFVSRKRGAIFLAFAPEAVSELPGVPARVGAAVASARAVWQEAAGGAWQQGAVDFTLEPTPERSAGWQRGRALVEEVLSVHAALAALQGRGDPLAADRAIGGTLDRMLSLDPTALQPELELLYTLSARLHALRSPP